MAGEFDLVRLLHRADWTRLSLSAETSDGSAVLIAPGRRYWYRAGDRVTGCDGGRPWEIPGDDEPASGDVHWVSRPEPPLPRLLCPAWVLVGSRLRVRGRVSTLGRDALDVEVMRRPTVRGTPGPAGAPGPVEVLVDAELGILLRVAEPGGDPGHGVTELVSADFGPVTDSARFMPPPGSRIAESAGQALRAGGPVWWAVKTAAGLAAGGLGAWIRYSPLRQPPPAGTGVSETGIPRDEPPPGLPADGVPPGPPVAGEVLGLLHAGGPGEFAATLHDWTDFGAMASQVPPAGRRAGFGGLGLLLDSVSERPATVHLTSALHIAGPGVYRIDRAYQPPRGPAAVICDGHRRWQVYGDKVTSGPAAPPPGEIGDLADPSWLLQCGLSGGARVMNGDRPAYRIDVARGDTGWSAALIFPAAVAVVDAEQGILLRLTSYIGAKPVRRLELEGLTTGGGFPLDLPTGLPVVEETRPATRDR